MGDCPNNAGAQEVGKWPVLLPRMHAAGPPTIIACIAYQFMMPGITLANALDVCVTKSACVLQKINTPSRRASDMVCTPRARLSQKSSSLHVFLSHPSDFVAPVGVVHICVQTPKNQTCVLSSHPWMPSSLVCVFCRIFLLFSLSRSVFSRTHMSCSHVWIEAWIQSSRAV